MIATQQQINCGAECKVFDTEDDNIVFKLYVPDLRPPYTKQQVQRIIQLNREYAERGLAPQVYSDIIEQNGSYGYYVERIVPANKLPEDYDEDNAVNELANELGVDTNRTSELDYNWGLTKDKRPVLFDFGLLTLYVLGLVEDNPEL